MKPELKSCFRICLALLLLVICVMALPKAADILSKLLSAATPLLIGCVIAYLLNILMSAYERRYFPRSKNAFIVKSRRPVCIILAMVTLTAVIAIVAILVFPQLSKCFALLFGEIPDAVSFIASKLEEWDILSDKTLEYLNSVDWNSKIAQIFSIITTGIGNVTDIVINTISSVFGVVVTALIALIFSIYILAGKEKLLNQYNKLMHRYVKPAVTEKINHVLSTMNDCFRRYIIGQCTEAVILGILCMIGMWIFRLPYAAMIGAVIALTALIPVAGAYIGGVIGAFMIFTVSPIKALIFIIFLVILQQLEGNIIYPRVVGASIGLPGIWVLAAVTIGGGVMGIVGMLLGVPLAATIYRLLKENINNLPD